MRCLLSKAFQRACQKNYISGYILHRSFIQTIKCSLLDQIILFVKVAMERKEKLCVLAPVSKSLAWSVFTCVEKIVFRLCLLHKMGLLKRVYPVLFDKKKQLI